MIAYRMRQDHEFYNAYWFGVRQRHGWRVFNYYETQARRDEVLDRLKNNTVFEYRCRRK